MPSIRKITVQLPETPYVGLGLENTKWDWSIVLCAIESKVHSKTNHEGLERGA